MANLSDYRLWINRSHSKGDSLYYDAVKYKILMHYAPPAAGSCTNLEESEEIVKANMMALQAGYNYSITTELFHERDHVAPASLPTGEYRQITGNQALSLG